jgi:hypothetical protein
VVYYSVGPVHMEWSFIVLSICGCGSYAMFALVTVHTTYASITRRVRKIKLHHVLADREICYAYYGNTAVDLDPLPVSRARLTVVEPALFE